MSREIRGRNRPCKPIPPTFPNMVNTEKWDTKDITYTLTPDQLQEVYAKYGEPLRPLSKQMKDMGRHRPSGKKGKK